ncbi:MAG: glycosyltransferase family 1 protein [Pseudomonadota bacterium]
MPQPLLRIALISEHASPLADLGTVDAGGQNTYVLQVARSLAEAGHEVDVFTRRDARHLEECVEVQPGFRVFHITAGPPTFVPKEALLPWMDDFAKATLKLMRRGPAYDVVHANFFMSGLVGLAVKEQLGVPLVVTFHALGRVRREHQPEADAFPPARMDIEQRLVREADRLIAECPQDRLDLMRLYGARDDRVSLVSCGVDFSELYPVPQGAARRRLGVADDEFVILQLGRLVPRKGIDNVIRSLAWLPLSVKVRLLIVGGETSEPDENATPEIGRLRRVALEMGVSERVSFLGRRARAELRDCYAAANVFVTTPWYEPFGLTPLEAMACGVPVVGSEVGGIAYTVQNGVTGYLVPPRDPLSLAQRLMQLHRQPNLARAMGLAGLQRARSLFTWPKVTADLVEVYTRTRHPSFPSRRVLPVAVARPFAAASARGLVPAPEQPPR